MSKRFNIILSCDHRGCHEMIHLNGYVHEFATDADFTNASLGTAAEIGWTWPGDTKPYSLCYCPLHSTATRIINDLARRGSPPIPEQM